MSFGQSLCNAVGPFVLFLLAACVFRATIAGSPCHSLSQTSFSVLPFPPATRLVSLSLRFLQRFVSAPFALPMYVWPFVRSCVQVQHTHTPTVFSPNASTLAHVSRCAIAWGKAALKLRVTTPPEEKQTCKHVSNACCLV